MPKHEGKVAFITGANKGIGLETARGLGQLGIAVVIGSRDEANGRAAVDKLRSEGIEKVESVRFDVTRPEDHQAIARHLEGRYGKLDILVNNAGVLLDDGRLRAQGGFNTTSTVTSDDPPPDVRDELLRRRRPHADAPAADPQVTGRADRQPVEHPRARSTLHSDPSSPIYAMKAFAYDASKTALNAFTVHLAHELNGTPIKVNSAHPGWVKTDMGGTAAPMELSEGGKTSVQLATLPDDGPTGGFFHLGQPLPW